jgi:type II secretory pathway pseudopilin PulG
MVSMNMVSMKNPLRATRGANGRRQCGRRRDCDSRERGYVLLTLLLMVSLMIIAAAAVVQTVAFQIKRDREEEMVHRGVQYARAIRSYYKKFGRYPTKIEDLESANNQRFLRKRYKDPITNKDFKLLHFGEAKLTLSNLLGGGGIPGANPIGGASGLNGANGLNGSGGLSGASGFGDSGMSSGFGNSNPRLSRQGSNQGQDASDPSTSPDGTNQDPNQSGTSGSGDALSRQVFGGGPIVGVVSISKKDGIREFDHKKKYDQWQFVYDPATDRGGLIKGPNQTLPMFAIKALQPGQNGQPGQPGSPSGSPFGSPNGPGNNSSFGGSSFGSNSPGSSPSGSSPETPAPPPNPPPQQQ